MTAAPTAPRLLQASLFPGLAEPLLARRIDTGAPPGAVAIAPGNDLSRRVSDYLRQRHGRQVRLFDRRGAAAGEGVADYAALAAGERCFVLSGRYGTDIAGELAGRGIAAEHLLADDLYEVGALAAALAAEAATVALPDALLEAPRVALLYSCFIYDVAEKRALLEGRLGYTVVELAAVPEPVNDGGWRLDPAQATALLRRRAVAADLLLVTHPIHWFALLPLLRACLPESRILSYVYDWLGDVCPYTERQHMQRQLACNPRHLESEYRAYAELCRGEWADGVLYKDAVEPLGNLAGNPLPRLRLYPLLSGRQFQPMAAEPPESRKRLLFIGNLYTPEYHAQALFADSFFEPLFRRLAAQGFSIDVYYPPHVEAVAGRYCRRLADVPAVRLLRGAPLDELLPQLAGRYDWGWMLFDRGSGVTVRHLRSAIPSRLFAFLALGLPMLVSSELEASAAWVEEQGFGLAVPLAELDGLAARVAGCDYLALWEGVRRGRGAWQLERQQGRLIRFIAEGAEGG